MAERLREASRLLHVQGATPYRVSAYRSAADAIARHPRDVRAILQAEGVKGLDAIPHVGLGIASAVAELLVTRQWAQLERLRGTSDPEIVLRTVPGVGAALARRIHETLHVDTLAALEAAAHDGRLECMPGLGPRRAAALRASLDDMLGARRRPRAAEPHEIAPVELVLAIDREYREKAAAGGLHTIAPRRFDPEGHPSLPVLHAHRGEWHFTAIFSDTALAHRLRRARDWVVIHYYDGDHVERHCTVVTETRGPLAGLRVVRGREAECRGHYAQQSQPEAPS